uniref:Centromere protein M n=1 Tax=Cyprinus carpio TaxID=7962 RepID=A0A8C1XZA5_CYPCA
MWIYSREQHLFQIEIFRNIINVFTVTFNQFNASLLNKSMKCLTDPRCFTCSVIVRSVCEVNVRKLAASHQSPVLCAEHRKADGMNAAAVRLLKILKVFAGMSPIATTALYLSSLTRSSVTSDLEED